MTPELPIFAVCVVMSPPDASMDISGEIRFLQNDVDVLDIEAKLKGFTANKNFGFTIHEYGDLRNGCDDLGDRFIPMDAEGNQIAD